jgi:trk system potassium uptake protein TrkA
MTMRADYGVIGLGVFGANVARGLEESGQRVLAVDVDPDVVQVMAADLESVVCADATDEVALRELNLEGVSCAVIAIGAESKESSILATALCAQLGIPRVVARALSDLHARVLRAVGAHQVVTPEVEMGQRLARHLAHPNVLDHLNLGEQDVLAEIRMPEAFADGSLTDLDIRRRYGISVIAIRRDGKTHASIDGDDLLRSGDVLIVIGPQTAIERVATLA